MTTAHSPFGARHRETLSYWVSRCRADAYAMREADQPALTVCAQMIEALCNEVERHQDEVGRLRQGLWDVAIETGFDNDGDETPDHMVFPDIVTLAKREVERLREDYDNATERRGPDA